MIVVDPVASDGHPSEQEQTSPTDPPVNPPPVDAAAAARGVDGVPEAVVPPAVESRAAVAEAEARTGAAAAVTEGTTVTGPDIPLSPCSLAALAHAAVGASPVVSPPGVPPDTGGAGGHGASPSRHEINTGHDLWANDADQGSRENLNAEKRKAKQLNPEAKKRRANLPKESVKQMKAWLVRRCCCS